MGRINSLTTEEPEEKFSSPSHAASVNWSRRSFAIFEETTCNISRFKRSGLNSRVNKLTFYSDGTHLVKVRRRDVAPRSKGLSKGFAVEVDLMISYNYVYI